MAKNGSMPGWTCWGNPYRSKANSTPHDPKDENGMEPDKPDAVMVLNGVDNVSQWLMNG